MSRDLIVISVGGSLIAPEQIDADFLKSFQGFILKYLKKGKRFIIVCGGGKTSRRYQEAGRSLEGVTEPELDWLGIYGTRLNACLVKAMVSEKAHPKIIENPLEKINFKEKILVAAGWQPGFSTDYVTTLLAKKFKAKTIVNLTNIDYVYDKNPSQFSDAKPLKKISWPQFRERQSKKWQPGLNSPFDPIASKIAQKSEIKVVIMNGKNIRNIENYLEGKNFIGTVIGD